MVVKKQIYKLESHSKCQRIKGCAHTDIDLVGILKSIAEKLPPTEKLFGLAWIVCWIAAIWTHPLQFFLTGLFCLFIAIIISGNEPEKKEKTELLASLSMDKNTKTLTVQKIYEGNLKWEDSEICSGSATLPSGSIKEGDVITKCNGNVSLRHIPTNTILGAYDFE